MDSEFPTAEEVPDCLSSRRESLNPARRFGVYPTKGHLLPGADADLAVIDPEREWVMRAEDLHSIHKVRAFTGMKFKGAVEQTIVRGQVDIATEKSLPNRATERLSSNRRNPKELR